MPGVIKMVIVFACHARRAIINKSVLVNDALYYPTRPAPRAATRRLTTNKETIRYMQTLTQIPPSLSDERLDTCANPLAHFTGPHLSQFCFIATLDTSVPYANAIDAAKGL